MLGSESRELTEFYSFAYFFSSPVLYTFMNANA